MPDYSLPKKIIPTQEPPQEPITQLSQASQQRKLETENALLREALAKSAQNCEKLIQQSNQSLMEITEAWKALNRTVMEIQYQIQENDKKHQAQLKQLENMNQTFTKSLKDVLTLTSDKLIAQVKADTDKALKSNIQAIRDTEKGIKQAVSRITAYDKELITLLNRRINSYQSSINQLFKLDGWRHKMFWAGAISSIATPIALIITHFL